MPAAVVYIVRHGETEENRTGVMQGQLDTQLNEAGVEQARLTAGALDHVEFVRALSSDLSRAVKTAEIILERQPTKREGNVPLELDEALRERYMGDMQGKSIEDWEGPMPANMESTASFTARADKWWKGSIVRYVSALAQRRENSRKRAEAKDPDGEDVDGEEEGDERKEEEPAHILVVSHGGLIRVLLQDLIGSRRIGCGEGVEVDRHRLRTSSQLRCPNASVTVIEVEKSGKGTLVMLADTTHLDVELVDGNVDIVEDDEQSVASNA